MDLLEYTQELIKQGKNTGNAYKLQAILQNIPVKNSEQGSNKMSYIPWIIRGVAVISLALIVGYLVGLKMKLWQFPNVKTIDFPEGYKLS